MRLGEQESIIEAILFAVGDAVPLSKLAEALDQDARTTKLVLQSMMDKRNSRGHGIHIIEVDESYQMCTNPDFFPYVQKLVQIPTKKSLTPPLLETLAIIAYKQPITKQQIEDIRGVNADHAVNRLLEYGLIAEKGRHNSAGRPILFGTSNEFLRHFGFSSLSRLPALESDYERLRTEAEAEVYNRI